MDRLTSMTVFITVTGSGSFAAAAKRLNLSPAAVTNHVQALEDHLGVRLINRTTRKLSLTEAGQHYFDRCTDILQQIEEADGAIGSLTAAPRGTLRVNATTVISTGLDSLISGFSRTYPEIVLEIIVTDQMPDLVEDGIDVAIRYNHIPDSSLVVRRLGGIRIIACAAPAYLERRGTPRIPADLAQHNCIAYTYPGFTTFTREWPLIGPEGEISVPVSGNLHTNSAALISSAALEGRGIIMAPTFFIDRPLREGLLIRVLPDYHINEFQLIALFPHRRYMPAKLRVFLDFAAKHFAADPQWQLAPSRSEKAPAAAS